MKSEKELLEDILVAQVIAISHSMDAARLKNGTTRIGGDYTSEAIAEIKQKRSHILKLLLSS